MGGHRARDKEEPSETGIWTRRNAGRNCKVGKNLGPIFSPTSGPRGLRVSLQLHSHVGIGCPPRPMRIAGHSSDPRTLEYLLLKLGEVLSSEL